MNRDHTVQVSRDEDGRTRTRIIIQKRSYLDPGTETFPGERGDHDYAVLPNHRAAGVLDNTVFGTNETALPGPWTLPGKNNPGWDTSTAALADLSPSCPGLSRTSTNLEQ